MNKSSIVLLAAILFSSCSPDEDSNSDSLTYSQMLTNGNSKVWNITEFSSKKDNQICDASREMNRDNSWTFFSNGKLQFDRGTIVDDDECTGHDPINFIGSWELLEDDSFLLLKALYATENPENVFNDTLSYGRVEKLTLDELSIKFDGENVIFTPK